MFGRRSFLKAAAAAPLAAPAVLGSVGQALNDSSNKIADASMPAWKLSEQTAIDPEWHARREAQTKALRAWIKSNEAYVRELRDSINRETLVAYIDADLMAMKSLSQAARIYYMRQRLVESRLAIQLDYETSPSTLYQVQEKWMQIAMKALGIEL